MGIDSRRPPLPAPTESMDEHSGVETELATNITSRTDKTSYSIPEDGSPITISTQKLGDKDGGGRHRRQKSQTSLLIEYFEASKSGDKSKSKPSVRVRVSSSAAKKDKASDGAVQITGIGQDRKPSYTRRISLSGNLAEAGRAPPVGGTELSNSSGSNPPVEIEVMKDGSDVSRRGLRYAPEESNVSSMPPDSLLEATSSPENDRRRRAGGLDDDYLQAPVKDRDRSTSRDRIAQKVMEKLEQSGTTTKPHKSSKSGRERMVDSEGRRRRRSSKSQNDDEAPSGAESSLVSSHLSPSHRSYHSNSSQASRMTNNPKLLEMVEDTIKRMILPEIDAIKQDQKIDRNLRSFDSSKRGSLPRDGYDEEGLERRLSKSSSTPNIHSKPKVVLNRDGDDPGTVLSRGDSEYRKARKSSRDSGEHLTSSRRSSGHRYKQGDGYDVESSPRHRSRRSNRDLKDMALAGVAGGALTAAALRHHDSYGDVHSRRKKHSRSRSSKSRSASNTETQEVFTRKGDIPAMPLTGHDDSDLTRESLMSSGLEKSRDAESATPTRRPLSRGLGVGKTSRSIDSPTSPGSTKARAAALAAAAAGLTGTKSPRSRHVDADGYGDYHTTGSPVQSVSSLKKQFEEDDQLIPAGLRPKSAASYSSAGRVREQSRSAHSSPGGGRVDRDLGGLETGSPFHKADLILKRDVSSTPGTPNGESVEEWYERQHRMNQKYRNSYGESNRDSYQTNPYADDDANLEPLQDIKPVGLQPGYVHDSFGAESNVASLMNPSMISNSTQSYQGSPGKPSNSYADRMNDHLRDMGKNGLPAMYEGSTLSQTMPSQDRWAAIKGHARSLSTNNSQDSVDSPRHISTKSPRGKTSPEPVMGASGIPIADDPLPEIGHFDDSKSDVTTNPSIIHGPLGGDVTGNSTWPYTPEPHMSDQRGLHTKHSPPLKYGHAKEVGLATVAAGGAAALMATHSGQKAPADDERLTPDNRRRPTAREATPSSQGFRDEGYVTDNRTRSAGAVTPGIDQQYSKGDVEDFQRAMDAQDLGDDDPFTGRKAQARKIDVNANDASKSLYDSTTSQGVDKFQSKEIVALMDHLTIRDARRNARDTEILVTLVRSAAEMRQSFDEMKKFITEQDRLIMQNASRDAEQTVQKVLVGGPRPQPASASRARTAANSQEEIQTKRKNVLRRALKGLTGSKRSDDLARVEDMLMQILDNVEDLKQAAPAPQNARMTTNESMETYEKLRAGAGSGYEPEGQAGTSSTPSQSGYLATNLKAEKQLFHSGYDGRRGSVNRVSTVVEGDEDDLEPHEDMVLRNQFENNERMLTPTQATTMRNREVSLQSTPPQYSLPTFNANHEEMTPRTVERHVRHKSNSSSGFGVPKISRWSKTTTSSAAPDPANVESPRVIRGEEPTPEASRSDLQFEQYDDDEDDDEDDHDDDRSVTPDANSRGYEGRMAHMETRSMRSQSSRLTRTPSPLIPSEASSRQYSYDDLQEPSPIQEDLTFDDPKYHAHRNSLLLQHPQPRQGSTSRHQTTLETQAHDFDDPSTNSDVSQRTVSDFDPAMWGSTGTAALARNRFSQAEPISPVSMSSPTTGYGNKRHEDSLIPQHPNSSGLSRQYEFEDDESDDMEWEPQYSNSGFGKGGYYSSPYGSGHLLEPIQEVRNSLETDRTISPDPQVSSAQVVEMRSPGRKITGPRPMGGIRGPATDNTSNQRGIETSVSGTVRRKPLPGSRDSVESLDSETF